MVGWLYKWACVWNVCVCIYIHMCLCLVIACMNLCVFPQFCGIFCRINCILEEGSLLLRCTFIYFVYIYVHMLLGVCGCQKIIELVRVSDLTPCGSWGLNLDCQAWWSLITFTHWNILLWLLFLLFINSLYLELVPSIINTFLLYGCTLSKWDLGHLLFTLLFCA